MLEQWDNLLVHPNNESGTQCVSPVGSVADRATLQPVAGGLSNGILVGVPNVSGSAVSPPKKYDAGKAPVYNGFFLYFPRAIKAVANVSKFGAEKYNVPYSDQNWRGVESARFRDAEGRHMLDAITDGLYTEDSKLLHAAHKAWNAMQELEMLLSNGTPEVRP